MDLRILDGGLGTLLTSRGCDLAGPLWSARVLLERPEDVEQAHLDFLGAGADCITTASYQVSATSFAKAGLAPGDADRALKESVEAARRAKDRFLSTTGGSRNVFIAASAGPYGASLADGSEYHGNYRCSKQELIAFHEERVRTLAAAGPDLLAFETIPSWEEAEAMLDALRRNPGTPAWFSFTCRDERHTAHGDELQECARRLSREPAVTAIGVNCIAPRLAAPLIAEIRSSSEKTIVVYPNSGQTWDPVGRCWTGDKSNWDIAAAARQWYAGGARWIGGCCGIFPQDIAALRAALTGEAAGNQR